MDKRKLCVCSIQLDINKVFYFAVYVYVIDMNVFHSIMNEVKVGKGSSVFSERTDDSSAVQYFQVNENKKQFVKVLIK